MGAQFETTMPKHQIIQGRKLYKGENYTKEKYQNTKLYKGEIPKYQTIQNSYTKYGDGI